MVNSVSRYIIIFIDSFLECRLSCMYLLYLGEIKLIVLGCIEVFQYLLLPKIKTKSCWLLTFLNSEYQCCGAGAANFRPSWSRSRQKSSGSRLRLQLYLKNSKLLKIVSLISDNIIIFDIHIPRYLHTRKLALVS